MFGEPAAAAPVTEPVEPPTGERARSLGVAVSPRAAPELTTEVMNLPQDLVPPAERVNARVLGVTVNRGEDCTPPFLRRFASRR